VYTADGGQEDVPEEELTARMRSLLQPFLLRRLKEQVASQLVPKQQQVQWLLHAWDVAQAASVAI
jgi:SNF2 family DNA or RNA helicase